MLPDPPARDSFLGHCWCVDGEGQYVPASLTARSPQPPQCKWPWWWALGVVGQPGEAQGAGPHRQPTRSFSLLHP